MEGSSVEYSTVKWIFDKLSHSYIPPLAAEQCHKLHTVPTAAEHGQLFLKRLTFLKRLARHRSTEQPSFRLINVSEIIFQMLIEELLLNNIKLITFKTTDFGEGEIGLCFL